MYNKSWRIIWTAIYIIYIFPIFSVLLVICIIILGLCSFLGINYMPIKCNMIDIAFDYSDDELLSFMTLMGQNEAAYPIKYYNRQLLSPRFWENCPGNRNGNNTNSSKSSIYTFQNPKICILFSFVLRGYQRWTEYKETKI